MPIITDGNDISGHSLDNKDFGHDVLVLSRTPEKDAEEWWEMSYTQTY